MVDMEKLIKTFNDAKVLYVEDDETVQAMSLPLYKKIFGHVDTASDGEAGLALFKENDFDIVITDLRMPKMNGRVMLENILKFNPNIIVIVLTASESRIDIAKESTDIYLNKPFGLMDFLEALQSVGEKYRSRKSGKA